MRKNKKAGFSLIELIVVIAILAIAATGAVSAFISLSGWHLKQAADSINNGIKKTRVLAMTREDSEISFVLTCRGGKYYMTAGGEDEKEIGSANITIKYTDTQNNETILGERTTLTLTFVRSSGAFQPIRAEGTDNIYCKEIRLTQGSKTRTVKLVQLTGNTYIEGS